MRVLIVGMMEGHVISAAKMAMTGGANVSQVESTDQALRAIRSGKGADLLMVDVKQDIRAFITSLANERINLPVVACGIGVKPEIAADAIRAGARDYLPLPPDSELIAAVLRSVAQNESTLICRDDVMRRCVNLAEKIAPSDASILITGESGTGKEVMAQHIHQNSKRKHKPFVSVNCAAIPENLLESELFGHEKGAFTGAVAKRIGKFEEANHGTLLLDEISEMHPRLQAKLLRAIQERVIDRVGGTQPIKVDIRIIATSNRDLLQYAKSGEFREDLYYRLNVVNLHVPPLRQRPDDIELLARHFSRKYSELNGIPFRLFSPKAIQSMQAYDWPGNVRELENCIHRSVLLAQGEKIESCDIFQEEVNAAVSNDETTSKIMIGRTIADVERELILNTLTHCSGNRTHAATVLGISIRTLRNKLNEYSSNRQLIAS
jgi:two-component system response regulator FlrC